jgi:hypothetical protein
VGEWRTNGQCNDFDDRRASADHRGAGSAGACAWLSPSRSISVSNGVDALALCSMLSWHLVLRVMLTGITNNRPDPQPDCPPYGGKLGEESASLCGDVPRETFHATPQGSCVAYTSTFAGQTFRSTTITRATITIAPSTTTKGTSTTRTTTTTATSSPTTTTTTTTTTTGTPIGFIMMVTTSVPLTEQTNFLIAVIVGPVLLAICVVVVVAFVAVRAKRHKQKKQKERDNNGKQESPSTSQQSHYNSSSEAISMAMATTQDSLYCAPPVSIMQPEYNAPPQAMNHHR